MHRALIEGWKKIFWSNHVDRTNTIKDIYFRFYNGITFEEFVDVKFDNALELLRAHKFDKSGSTVIYIHGFVETPLKDSVRIIVNAYLQSKPDTNIVLLDWSNMAHGSYLFNAAPNTKKVGIATVEQLKILLDAGLSLEKLHLIGHSLGSHVAGYLARELKTKYGKSIKRLTALDPAFPAFYPNGIIMEHVSPQDADFVDVIHTDAGSYGAPVSTGTADFWPNGGKAKQPGCPRFAPLPFTAAHLCSHWRSWRFFAESVVNPEAFPASPSDSYEQFVNNLAPERDVVYMGYNCDTKASGSYFLITNESPPFGKGKDGLYAVPLISRKSASCLYEEIT